MASSKTTNWQHEGNLAYRRNIEGEPRKPRPDYVQEVLRRRFDDLIPILDELESQVWLLFDEYTYGSSNKAHADFLGVPQWKLANRPISGILSKEEAELCIATNREVLKKKIKIQTKEWVRDGQGQKRLLSITKKPRLDNEGNVVDIICVAEDITGKRLSGQRFSHGRYRLLVDSLSELICCFKPDTTLIFANAAYYKYLNKTAEELIGKKLLTFLPAEEHKKILKNISLLNKYPIIADEVKVVAGDSIRCYEWRYWAVHNDKGEIVEIHLIGRDITKFKIKEKDLQETYSELEKVKTEVNKAKSVYRALLENTGNATVIIEKDMTISMFNSECSEFFGFAQEELTKKKLGDLITCRDKAVAEKNGFLSNAGFQSLPQKHECWITDNGGRNKRVLVSADIIPQTTKTVVTFTDITELNRVNRALKTISCCNLAIVQADSENDLLDTVCRRIIEAGGYSFVWVGFLENEGNIVPKAYAGIGREYLQWLYPTLNGAYSSLPSRAINTKKPVICRSTVKDEDFGFWGQAAIKSDFASVIAIPLICSGDVPLGVICIYSDKVDFFDNEEADLLTEMAADLAYGITSLRAREDRDKAAGELKQSLDKMQRILRQSVTALSAALEIRDPYTAGHQRRVAQLSVRIAEELGLPENQIEGINVAGSLHDIGKINIPIEILSKPGILTEMEMSIIRTHSEIGYEILKDIEFPWPVAKIILQHHERYDGTGFPFGLEGNEILLEARILAVADVVEAMTFHRPYRPALGLDAGLREITRNRNVLYDPEVVDACLMLFKEKGYQFD